MNEEIKEALETLYGVVDGRYRMDEAGVRIEEIEIILDCITNLQESEAYYYGQYKDYKSRIDKAIEYITSEQSIETFKTIESREDWLKINHNLLNILQGSDKE